MTGTAILNNTNNIWLNHTDCTAVNRDGSEKRLNLQYVTKLACDT